MILCQEGKKIIQTETEILNVVYLKNVFLFQNLNENSQKNPISELLLHFTVGVMRSVLEQL